MSGKITNLYGVDQYMTGISGEDKDLIKAKYCLRKRKGNELTK